jgi:hypothetical protein
MTEDTSSSSKNSVKRAKQMPMVPRIAVRVPRDSGQSVTINDVLTTPKLPKARDHRLTRLRRQDERAGQVALRRCLRACRQAKIGTNSRTLAFLNLSSECFAAWSIKSWGCPSNSSLNCVLSLGRGSLNPSSRGLVRS